MSEFRLCGALEWMLVEMEATPKNGQGRTARLFNGPLLREERRKRGLSLRDVEAASRVLADRQKCPELLIHRSRLSAIENGGTPGAVKLAAIASILKLDVPAVLRLFAQA